MLEDGEVVTPPEVSDPATVASPQCRQNDSCHYADSGERHSDEEQTAKRTNPAQDSIRKRFVAGLLLDLIPEPWRCSWRSPSSDDDRLYLDLITLDTHVLDVVELILKRPDVKNGEWGRL